MACKHKIELTLVWLCLGFERAACALFQRFYFIDIH
jgi:hypothetical protein